VATGIRSDVLASLSPRATTITRIGDDRYVFDLPVDPAPDRFITDLTASGAALLSVNPLRDTLEDFFVKQVTAPEVKAHDRGLGTVAAGDRR
jgi:hypothetical protein